MTMTITERDKKLLVVTACVVILLVGIRFLILPAWEEKTLLEEEREQLTWQKQEWEAEIAAIPSLEESIARETELRDAAQKPYYDYLESRQMDEILTNLSLKHGLFPKALELTQAAPGSVPDYVLAEQTKERDLTPRGSVWIGTARMVLQGDTEEWTALLDDILGQGGRLRVTAYDVKSIVYVDEKHELAQVEQITADLALYMCTEGGDPA